ncbi:metal-dependent transcriptional regulator [Corynebacterium freneyi]|uniref:Diphtheria toxin repressor n=1 Tax=Corynebacterium freneyi DNF00450 TaxID=1287475 RepID=A0A096A740_9CORY|nr:metal-dependent transcriptional regulator [Corynebacterium freneyi]KGF16704.1 hypothetical protein HMPREF1650_06760 [Corynebacterium freneyi DNF00450]
MELTDLSDSAQNYLKTLWTLSEWSGAPVPPSEVAAHLGLRPSSVSDQIRRLREQSLVKHAPYGAVSLTPEGRRLALQMVRRHRLVETFLAEVLCYPWDEVHEDADRLEHAVSDRMLERLNEYLGSPAHDPHGDPIPGPDGDLGDRGDRPLTSSRIGEAIEITRIRDADPALLRHLGARGVVPGAGFTISDDGASSGVIALEPASPEGGAVAVSVDVAESIRIAAPRG